MLSYYGLEDKYDAMKAWYDGYRFGSTEVYCPWDVINYVDKLQVKRNLAPQNYWSNTSGNDVCPAFYRKNGERCYERRAGSAD